MSERVFMEYLDKLVSEWWDNLPDSEKGIFRKFEDIPPSATWTARGLWLDYIMGRGFYKKRK